MFDRLRLGGSGTGDEDIGKKPQKIVPCLAAIVGRLAQRPEWQKERPFQVPDVIYLGGYEEMHHDFVLKRGYKSVPADERLLQKGVENFMVQGAIVVPEGDSIKPVTPSLTALRERQEKDSTVDLWADAEKRRRLRGYERI